MSKSLRTLSAQSKHVYDYVVVGGGSAGCVMANRLSTNPKVRVALLETGPDDDTPIVQNPSGFFWSVPHSRKYNHRFFSTPQKHLNNRKVFQPRGKVLGGSSSINAMVYIRGLKYDYNRWADEGECEGWDYDSMLPIFKAHEGNDSLSDEYHGTSGPLKVRTQSFVSPLSEKIIEGSNELGLKTTKDFNGADQSGVGLYQYTQSPAKRCNAASAFLPPSVRSRPNLDIITEAQATKVLTEGKQAVGVDSVVSGSNNLDSKVKFAAKKEVILCGGAFNSPQLLMLSGIGPKAELNNHGIDVVHELPGVGQNLQDHADITVNARSKRVAFPLQIAATNVLDQAKHVWKLFTSENGVFAGDMGVVGSFFKSSPDVIENDIQQHVAPLYYREAGKVLAYGGGISVMSCYLRPEARGTVTLNSANPLDAPVIDPNYYALENDIVPMVKSVRMSLALINTKAMQEEGMVCDTFPDPDNVTDAEIREFLKNETDSIYHPVATCTMGPASNPMAVVDHKGLKVHGMEGLRVIDASVMPFLLSGNTNAPTMAVAERAFQMMTAEQTVSDNKFEDVTDSQIVA